MPDPRYAIARDGTATAAAAPSTDLLLDPTGTAARGQAAELLAGSTATSRGTFADRPPTLTLDDVVFVAPDYLGKDSLRAFHDARTVVEGGRLLGPSIFWAAVLLAGMSTIQEYALFTGVSLAHGQTPYGSETDAVRAIPGVVRASLQRIIGGVIVQGDLTAEELRYWERLRARLGDF